MARLRNIIILVFLAYFSAQTVSAQRCGKERWSVKTGTDAGATGIDLSNPKPSSIPELIALEPPDPLPTDSRFAPTETTIFTVDATLTDFKIESGSTGDSDYHLVLEDEQGDTMVAEIPSPACVGAGSPFAAQIASVRAKFDSQFTVKSSFQTANIPVRVTGVGFFDFFHRQHGAAPNVIELHPVLDIIFNPGPASEDFTVSLSSGVMHLHAGSSSSFDVSATSSSGSVSSVAFTISGLPPGITAKVTPSGSGKANVLLTASANASTGTSPVVITGSGNGRSRSKAVALSVSAAPVTNEAQEWEYKMINARSEQDVIDQANQLGAESWEMVSVVRVSGTPAWRAFFKRPKTD